MKVILKSFIYVYKVILAPFNWSTCRYQPTCSAYALEAIEKHGPVSGLFLAIKRFLHCHPFSRRKIYDPVPLKSNKKVLG